MAFKLTSREDTERATLVQRANEAVNKVISARQEAQEAICAAVAKVNTAIEKYNNVREEVETFRDDVATRLREEYDNKSEKWQESERASSADDFISQWENLDTSELDEQDVPELDETEPDLGTDLEALSSEVE